MVILTKQKFLPQMKNLMNLQNAMNLLEIHEYLVCADMFDFCRLGHIFYS